MRNFWAPLIVWLYDKFVAQPPTPLTVEDRRKADIEATEHLLYDAKLEAERANSNVTFLTNRLSRLKEGPGFSSRTLAPRVVSTGDFR